MGKQKKRMCITQSWKNYAINYCTIQGVHLIWKQKIWLAICKFLWSLTNQNVWFVSSFWTELTLFCTVLKKTALLLTNQNGEINLYNTIVCNLYWGVLLVKMVQYPSPLTKKNGSNITPSQKFRKRYEILAKYHHFIFMWYTTTAWQTYSKTLLN